MRALLRWPFAFALASALGLAASCAAPGESGAVDAAPSLPDPRASEDPSGEPPSNGGASNDAPGAPGPTSDGGTGDASIPPPNAACTSCVRVLEAQLYKDFAFTDGTRIFFQTNQNGGIPTVAGVKPDGTGLAFYEGSSSCGYNFRRPIIHGGHVYFSRVPGQGHAAVRMPLGMNADFTCDEILKRASGSTQSELYMTIESGSNTLFTLDAGKIAAVNLATLQATPLATAAVVVPNLADATAFFDSGLDGAASYQRIRRLDRATGAVTVSASLLRPQLVKTDATNLYFVSSHRLLRLPKNNVTATPTEIAKLPTSLDSADPLSFVLDGGDLVYWAYGSTEIGRVPVTGGTATLVPTGGRKVWNVVPLGTQYYVFTATPAQAARADLWSIAK